MTHVGVPAAQYIAYLVGEAQSPHPSVLPYYYT